MQGLIMISMPYL